VSEAAATVLAQAARSLQLVAFGGRSADEALERDSKFGASVRAITLGTLRWYWRLDAMTVVLLGNARVVPAVRALLLVSLHQIEYSRNPPETIVSSAVDAVRVLGQPRASGMINALLRRFLRERTALMDLALVDEAAAAAHPRWLFNALRQHWPDRWQQIVDSNNSHPPMTLRVNLSRTALASYQAQLAARGHVARAMSWSPTALTLDVPVAVGELPGFSDGEASVQDAGAQLASALLGARAGERVLDACAAPGGKTGAILESAGGPIDLTAVDVDAGRARLISDNLSRLQLTARIVTADLATGDWSPEAFDRILLDAPCSATGVIRRHPDIKLLRREQDVSGFVATQRRILERCLGLLKSGGRLLYSTCSLLPDENERLVTAVLAGNSRARVIPLPADVALPPQTALREVGVQLLPGDAASTDGFYYACLTVT